MPPSDTPTKSERKALWGWALYDWANSSFAVVVLAGFFPILFKEYWNTGVDAATSTARLGYASAIASLIVAVLAPLLGALADRGGRRKAWLAAFTGLGVVMTGTLYFVQQGDWLLASAIFILAQVGFAGGLGFYDALLMAVTRPNSVDRTSGLGFALGYLGGGLLFAANVAMALKPQTFGFANGGEAARFSFLCVAIWWSVFALPLFFWVREPAERPLQPTGGALRAAIKELRQTLKRLQGERQIALFLIAYWVYIDGVDTVIRMAVDYGLALGFQSSDLITALLIVQFVGFPAALLFGWIGQRLGPKTGILMCLGVYTAVTLWATQMHTVTQFYGLAVCIALVQGGVQALSRSLYSRLIPPHKSAEYFGLYNMLGKFAAIVGPLLMAGVSAATGDVRMGLGAIVILFALGGLLLCFVRLPTVAANASAPRGNQS